MSTYRRAYECKSFDDWLVLSKKLNITTEIMYPAWEVATAAKAAGMDKKLAFPLIGELQKMKEFHDTTDTSKAIPD